MSTNNNWIKMTEIKPRLADLPIWVWEKERTGPTVFTNILPGSGWSHWKPADIPAPPRGQSQRDKDEDWLTKWMHCTSVQAINLGNAWHAALAYERAEVGKLLPSSEPATYNAHYATEVIKAIRARCGGGK